MADRLDTPRRVARPARRALHRRGGRAERFAGTRRVLAAATLALAGVHAGAQEAAASSVGSGASVASAAPSASTPAPSEIAPDAPPRAVPTAADPALEARMLAITSELRCLVCQNQTIADSHADLAVDLRQQVREQLRAGRSDDEVRRYMTDRYGDFVLYRPPFKGTTLALWLGPAALLAVAVVALLVAISRRGKLADDRFEPDPAWEDGDGGEPSAASPPSQSSPASGGPRPGAPA